MTVACAQGGDGALNHLLKSVGAVSALSPASLSLVKMRQGDVLFERGEALDRVYFPHSLVASMLVVAENGDSVDVGTIGCEGLLGPYVPNGRHTSITRQVVQVAGTATLITRDDWFQLLEAEPKVHAVVGTYRDAFMTQVIQSVACNALHTSEERFARWLLTMDDRVPGDDIALTHEVIGKMLGVRRPTVTLIAGAFQRAGLIASTRGRTQIAQRSGLEAVTCECYSIIKASYDELLRTESAGSLLPPSPAGPAP